MIDYTLPTELEVGGEMQEIRYDYRAILDCISVMNADDLNNKERAVALLEIFYVHPETLKDYKEALEQCVSFISRGTEERDTGRPYMNWEKDFKYIVPPVNAILRKEIRLLDELHWWTFLDAFSEIDKECTFYYIVSIRRKRARGKKLEDYEREFYRQHKSEIDLPIKHTKAEEELLKRLWDGVK